MLSALSLAMATSMAFAQDPFVERTIGPAPGTENIRSHLYDRPSRRLLRYRHPSQYHKNQPTEEDFANRYNKPKWNQRLHTRPMRPSRYHLPEETRPGTVSARRTGQRVRLQRLQERRVRSRPSFRGATRLNEADFASSRPAAVKPGAHVVTSDDYVRGNPNAEISVIEFVDFECPFCKRFHQTMRQVLRLYPNDVNWVYRAYPLDAHPHADRAAQAAECVGNLVDNDAFWQYADLLFTGDLTEDTLIEHAQEVGVHETELLHCLRNETYANRVKEQREAGDEAGVQGTPNAIVVNNRTGKKGWLRGARPLKDVEGTIDIILAD